MSTDWTHTKKMNETLARAKTLTLIYSIRPYYHCIRDLHQYHEIFHESVATSRKRFIFDIF
jgi:hypothetical protein